jgi:hypothetical protein
MLTLFAIPKAFRGHTAIIQRNAITSWTRLNPPPEIILFGDDPGTPEIAQELGVRHVPDVARNSTGAPMLDDLFAKAEAAASHPLLCYVNSDIMLMDDFLRALERVRDLAGPFLMVGQRWDLDLPRPWDFDGEWQQELRSFVRAHGRQLRATAVDYFAFTKGLGIGLLPLALGRVGWDNWLIWHARQRCAAVIDASAVVMAVHQNHDYSHHPGGQAAVWRGEEARRNRELIGDWYRLLTIEDANHRLTADGLKPSRRHSWLVLKRAWSHPAGVARLLGRTLVGKPSN